MQIKRNSSIPFEQMSALVALVVEQTQQLNPVATPDEKEIVRAIGVPLVGGAGPASYLGVAYGDADEPVGLLIGLNTIVPIEGGTLAHAAFLHARRDSPDAVNALVRDFETWAYERHAERIRVDATISCPLPDLAGYRQISASYVKQVRGAV
jgi:hypothetical protein